jgi:hypothetical protein
MTVILASQEVEIGRIAIPGQREKKLARSHLIHKAGLGGVHPTF